MNNSDLKDKKWYVYMHTNKINGKKYVGITSLNPERRWKNGYGYRKNTHFWNAIQKYGWDNFKHEILLQNETFEYACMTEKCLIKHYKTKDKRYGYNCTDGGEGTCGWVPSEEWRENRSRAMSGENHPLYGKHHSNETKRKISEKNIGKKMSDEACKKMSEHRCGVNNGKTKAVYCLELEQIYSGAIDAEKRTGVSKRMITDCCSRERVKHGGRHPITKELLTWRYATIKDGINVLINVINKIINKEI